MFAKYCVEMRQHGITKFEIFSSADNINLHKNSHILFNIPTKAGKYKKNPSTYRTQLYFSCF